MDSSQDTRFPNYYSYDPTVDPSQIKEQVVTAIRDTIITNVAQRAARLDRDGRDSQANRAARSGKPGREGASKRGRD